MHLQSITMATQTTVTNTINISQKYQILLNQIISMYHQNYISGYQERVRSSIKRSPTGVGIRCYEGCTTVSLFLDALTEELLGWGVFRCTPRWVDLHCCQIYPSTTVDYKPGCPDTTLPSSGM